VLSPQVSRVANLALQEVITSGTGTAARLPGLRPAAGKTGTAQNHQDAWFVGYTPQLATAVWMGSPVGEVPMDNVGGAPVTGGSYPAQIWRAYTAAALAGDPVIGFPAPDPKQFPKPRFLRVPGEKPGASEHCYTRRIAPRTLEQVCVSTGRRNESSDRRRRSSSNEDDYYDSGRRSSRGSGDDDYVYYE
jgi:membrane peptidoglycan carboxypeptidase